MYSGKDKTAIKPTGKVTYTHATLGLIYAAHDRQHIIYKKKKKRVQNDITQK
jgi:hypothetical protein